MTRPAEVEHGFGVFPYRGLSLVGGSGSTVWDEHGDRYLDAGGASYGTMNVGHAHPRVRAAIEQSAADITHTSQVFANPHRSALVEQLLELAGPWASRVFLSNSGTEAIEAAIKTALAHTGRSRIVAFEGGFHGRTLGALSATHKPAYREPFQARLGETTFEPFGDEGALAGALDGDVAAVIVEPVQGEAGVRLPAPGFLEACQESAREAGALLIVDEVQTGLGRTGHDMAFHREGLEPDLVCLAKSLAAGLPLGGTIAHERVQPLDRGQHGSTFGGNPIACRVALEVLGILEDEGLSQRATRIGDRLIAGLEALEDPLVREVRGQGAMVACQLGVRPTAVLKALQSQGVIALPGGDDAIRMLPPLVLTDDEADRIVETTGRVLEQIRERYAKEANA